MVDGTPSAIALIELITKEKYEPKKKWVSGERVGKGRMRTKVLPLPQLYPDLLFLANALIEGGKWVPNGNNNGITLFNNNLFLLFYAYILSLMWYRTLRCILLVSKPTKTSISTPTMCYKIMDQDP
jgi:hypothetical protein